MAIGLTAPNPLHQQSRKVGFDKELRMKASLDSIYTTLKGQYNTEKKTIPNAIYMTISDAALSDSWKARITMAYPLRGGGVFGESVAIGEEEQVQTKACEIYRSNCRKVVSTPGYGTTKLDADYLGLFEKHVDNLAAWNKEQEDLEIHQALVNTFGETLTESDVGYQTCTARPNPNVYVAGSAPNSPGVAYNANSSTHITNINTAITALGGVGNVRMLDALTLSNISNYALAKRINRLDIPGLPGGKGFVLTISELQAMYLGDPAWSSRNLGSLFIQKAALTDKVMNWPGVLGAYKDLLIVVDVRAPSVLVGPSLFTGQYVRPGDNDERTRAETNALDVAVIHGKGALWKWEPEPLHSIKQTDDYAMREGVGTACVRGIGIPIFYENVDTKAGAIEQFSSAVVLCGMPNAAP